MWPPWEAESLVLSVRLASQTDVAATVYEVAVTRVETMERSMGSYLRKWLGIP